MPASQELTANAAESVNGNLAFLGGDGHIAVCVGAALHILVKLNRGRVRCRPEHMAAGRA